LVCGSESRKWRIETKITRMEELRFFLERKRNRVKREKGTWEMYRKTESERR
jgi:hypothetical protein